MYVVQNPLISRVMTLPIYGASADLAPGSVVMPGTTAETNLGVFINGATDSNADCCGVLLELHDYSESGDALVNGTVDWFYPYKAVAPAHKVELVNTAVVCNVDYDTATAATVAGYSTPTVTITNLENNIDTSWLYTVAGTGLKQLLFTVTSAAGSCTIYSAATTALSTDTTLVKILRNGHKLVYWTVGTATAGTKIGTTAAAGAGRAFVLGNYMTRRGLHERLSPLAHHNLAGLSTVYDLSFYAKVQIQNTAFHPID